MRPSELYIHLRASSSLAFFLTIICTNKAINITITITPLNSGSYPAWVDKSNSRLFVSLWEVLGIFLYLDFLAQRHFESLLSSYPLTTHPSLLNSSSSSLCASLKFTPYMPSNLSFCSWQFVRFILHDTSASYDSDQCKTDYEKKTQEHHTQKHGSCSLWIRITRL